jgi:hypothetical protein
MQLPQLIDLGNKFIGALLQSTYFQSYLYATQLELLSFARASQLCTLFRGLFVLPFAVVVPGLFYCHGLFVLPFAVYSPSL